jgi:mono/diheme cytochrome c family protein
MTMVSRRTRHGLLIGIGLLIVAVLAVSSFLRRDQPELHADILEHYKYGSIGAEARSGVPYWIWRVLPRVFPEHLPNRPGDGYARLGFVYEAPDRVRPIGTSVRAQPIDVVGLNCAVCHTGTVRDAPGAPPRIVLGMPAHQLDLQGYLRFLIACGADERFNADTLLRAIHEENPSFSWAESLFYRFIVIPRTKDALRQQAIDFAWMDRRPPEGPGRVDTFNPYKHIFFGMDLSNDDSIGTADLPSLWDQRARLPMWLHWDGNNNSVEERNRSAALGAGASEASIDEDSLARVAAWILDLPAPRYPRDRIDQTRANAGLQVFQAHCAACHAVDGQRIGQVTPIAEIGTDRARLDSFTPEVAERMNTLGSGRPWDFSHFRKTDGYANMPLDGIWLRAPYLHNGSVPTLRDLLRPPAERPTTFIRGYDVYDYESVGFVSSGPEAERVGVPLDTRLPGNGNGGHLYGTTLTPEEKEALLEYLKTL